MCEIVRCKRCNAILKAEKSRKLGFGATCYRIHILEESNKSEESNVNTEIAFLKLEIKTLKRMIRNIQVKESIESIERIRKDVESIPNVIKEGFGKVVTEMKSIFNENFYYKDYLKPVNPIEEPITPPVMIEVLA